MTMLNSSSSRHNRNDAGFTLLEIIAVMVIMSILAVVAVPRYFDIQSSARDKAMRAAMAEAKGRINSYFAEQLLADTAIENIVYTTENVSGTDNPNMGDFHMTIDSIVDGVITITVTGIADPVAGESLTETLPEPGQTQP